MIIDKDRINLVKVVAIIAIAATMLFISILVVQNIKYSKFIKIEAKIINTSINTSTSNMSSHSYSRTYEYTYDGKKYISSMASIIPGHEIGTFEIIRCNPNNPQEIENTSLINTSIACAIFLGVISLFLVLGIYQYYNNNKKNQYVRYE